jgi:glucose-1-phosphate thymidylyltransferase
VSDLRDGWAVVPAAGVGTRLRPHTHTTPKPLLHVAGKPILGYILDEVVRLGIRKLALVVGYMGDQIVAFARKNYDFCEIVPVAQHEPQGLGQAVYLTRECAEGHPTLIVYGDTVFDTDLSEAVARQADGAIGVRKVDDPARFGVVAVDGRRILRLVEKPEQFVSDLAIVGINFIRDSAALYSALETLIDRDLRTRGEFQLTDAFNMMVERGSRLDTFPVENWFDCGAPDTLLATNRHLLGRQSQPDERPGVIQIPPVYISPSASVENSIIGPYVSVGEGAQVKDALVRDSIIGEGAHVTGCFLEKSLVGTNAMVESRPRRLNVGDSSEISLY